VSAVWFVRAMGLLDDAIREHLELKRLRGADPGEVAREQREALDPVPRNAPSDGGGPESEGIALADEGVSEREDIHDVDPGPLDTGEEEPVRAGHEERDPGAPAAQPSGAEDSSSIQETAELDMQEVLEEEDGAIAGAETATHSEDDSLEWEMPGKPAAVRGEGARGPREDGLEGREELHPDASEQERMEFEHRPRRDVDVDR
jgi:hypothetical protein